jgi:hypothetical protein
MSVIDSSTTSKSGDDQQVRDDARFERAREDDMVIALLYRGGCYEVDSASGNTYEVDLLDETCSCPDHQDLDTPAPCKHVRRVQLELDAGRIPRPDGRLPETALPTHAPSEATDTHLVATLRTGIREREEQIATLEAEIQALRFVCDVADVVEEGETFDLKEVLSDDHGPASHL